MWVLRPVSARARSGTRGRDPTLGPVGEAGNTRPPSGRARAGWRGATRMSRSWSCPLRRRARRILPARGSPRARDGGIEARGDVAPLPPLLEATSQNLAHARRRPSWVRSGDLQLTVGLCRQRHNHPSGWVCVARPEARPASPGSGDWPRLLLGSRPWPHPVRPRLRHGQPRAEAATAVPHPHGQRRPPPAVVS